MTNDKRFAQFLRDLGGQLRKDHYPLGASAALLDAYAEELDPRTPAAEPEPVMTPADVESAVASEDHAKHHGKHAAGHARR